MHESPGPGTLTPDDFHRIREVFESALDKPAAERRAFVEQACGGDTMLVAEVERMLAADHQGHQLLDRDAPGANRSAPATCPACHAALVQSHRFCPSCGTPLVESAAPSAGRFRAGAVFAHRFRIVSRLGHGGMGEVYRADDLELGQPVALKFLTVFRSDERARTRLRSEVRLARQISHPNVCRVYDIGEAHGDLYLSMEYVDGEDLAALLKRIGRLPIDKGIEIARKLCAGLAAAHAKGVLHRDFKPANIMIDSLGEVRIMDFGLAAVADQLEAKDVRSGTPAYMAPEQLAGREATKQSDLYALGLVLYELFTGKAAFDAKSVEEFLRLRAGTPATTPSTLIPEIGPRVEQVILRCLEPDPRQRPSSAFDVAASLPGGDPLAEALAAGETPSPEMVASAGSTEGLRPRVAIMLLAGIAACLAVAFFLAPRSEMLNRLPLEYPPDVLTEKAREIIRSAGYGQRPADSASGFQVDAGYVSYFDGVLGKSRTVAAKWTQLLSISPSPVSFWYRQSQDSLAPRTSTAAAAGRVQNEPPSNAMGTESIDLDPNGRLRRFVAVPLPSRDSGSGTHVAPEWSVFFKAAGLDSSHFRPVDTTSLATEASDTSAAWIGMYPGHDDLPVRVEARGYRGRATYFAVIFPWMNAQGQASRVDQTRDQTRTVRSLVVSVTLGLVVTLGVAFVSYYNWRAGRADLAGASRVGIFICVTLSLVVILGAHDLLATFTDQPVLPIVVFNGVAGALTYVAIEPWVRRLWPQAMISWSRVLAGRWRDPIVARDVLIAIFLTLSTHCVRQGLYAYFMPGRGAMPSSGLNFGFLVDYLMGPRLVASDMAALVSNGPQQAFQVFFLLFLCRALFKNPWLGAIAFVTLVGGYVLEVSTAATWIDSLSLLLVFVILALPIMIRFGFFAFAMWGFTGGLITQALLTNDFGAWYGQSSLMILVVFGAVTVWAFRTSLAGRPLLGSALSSRL